MTDDIVNQDLEELDEREVLEQIARERWGEKWTITQKHFADGTTQLFALHSAGPIRDLDLEFGDRPRVHEIERIWIDLDDAEVYWHRIHEIEAREALADRLAGLKTVLDNGLEDDA